VDDGARSIVQHRGRAGKMSKLFDGLGFAFQRPDMDINNNQSPFSRRDVLSFIGSVVAVGFVGCGSQSPTSPSSSSSSSSSSTGTTGSTSGTSVPTSSTNALCTVTPALTEGPYFVDERLNRSDIRTDPGTGAARAGVPLAMKLQLSQISALVGCTPLVGALVDIWHCDALGVYSDVSAQNSRGQRFLRGYQISDSNGEVQFTTIYPGWYQGRAVHIHFKVRTNPSSNSGLEFTSQLFFDEALTDVVHAQSPYASKGRRDTLNTRDGIYSGGGTQLLLPLNAVGGGYDGTMYVGVRV
jgi:protocatechuate 3,4-dioxygenase beta subunit